MKRIDMLGAAGTGKSTLNRALDTSSLAQTVHHPVFMQPAQARTAACAQYLSREDVNRRQRLYWHSGVLRVLACDRMESSGIKKAFPEFAERNNHFLAVAHEAFALSGRNEYRRAMGYYHFITSLRRLAFLVQWAGDVTVLFDESLSQKVYAVMPWDRDNEDLARRYFEQMPAPAGLVHLAATPELVVQRIRERETQTGKLIPGHRGLDDEALRQQTDVSIHFSCIGAEVLRQRRVPVLALDAARDAAANALDVLDFIGSVVQ